MSEEQIRVELEILVKEIAVAKSLVEDNKSKVFSEMVMLREQSPSFQGNNDKQKEGYYKWLMWNIFENELPQDSSGSFLTAVEDYDNNVVMLEGKDEVTDEQYELFDSLWSEIVRGKVVAEYSFTDINGKNRRLCL
tara:strand:- start:1350 stop:1757 length:408 start_codon:yes stop_codon:yes gene_type:complete